MILTSGNGWRGPHLVYLDERRVSAPPDGLRKRFTLEGDVTGDVDQPDNAGDLALCGGFACRDSSPRRRLLRHPKSERER